MTYHHIPKLTFCEHLFLKLSWSLFQSPSGSCVFQTPSGSCVFQTPSGSCVFQNPSGSSVLGLTALVEVHRISTSTSSSVPAPFMARRSSLTAYT